jgi:hypothetical protein
MSDAKIRNPDVLYFARVEKLLHFAPGVDVVPVIVDLVRMVGVF